MARSRDRIEPRTFFLNEQHELSPGEKSGGGALPKYEGIRWAAKAQQIQTSLETVVRRVGASRDPLRDDRFFVIAQPVPELEKRSENKRKAPQGTFRERTDFGGDHSKVFDRLGLDLLQVTDDGRAIVHAQSDKVEQLLQRSGSLESLGAREQARWATIDSFDTIPFQLRVDADWLRNIGPTGIADVVFELQPVLSRIDADRVVQAINHLLSEERAGKLTGSGSDFSGRYWFRGTSTQRALRSIAKEFFSIQSIHSPLYSVAAGKTSGRLGAQVIPSATATRVDPDELPCVAVVDLGVPASHGRLEPYRRGQFYAADVPRSAVGDHGSFVASRVVFGDHQDHDALMNKVRSGGDCSFFDVQVGEFPAATGQANRVNDKVVLSALAGVRGAAPDVRVYNLSFGNERPLAAFNEIERREHRLLLQDLDNFIFATDTLVIVASGNSPFGLIPNPEYPDHHQDARWALGPWACGFNTLVCGSFVSRIAADALVTTAGWPSPFSRIGPGLLDSPVPSFSAEGGNTNAVYQSQPGLGVWGLSSRGLPEDWIGTSHAAPILSREAAFVIDGLQRNFCEAGTQPFGVTARAFLALTSVAPAPHPNVDELAKKTLGYGKASAARLRHPASQTAVMLWQGYVDSPSDTVRVQLPIPHDWLNEALEPVLRLVVCYDPPVNEAATHKWACRRVLPVLKLHPDADGIRAPRGGHPSYPLIDRRYNLRAYKEGGKKPAEGDMWLIELKYDEVAPYPAARDFDPRQRVAFAAELYDTGESPVDPQAAMQALPIASTMTRLSIQPTAMRSPIIVKTRVS